MRGEPATLARLDEATAQGRALLAEVLARLGELADETLPPREPGR